MNQLVDEIAIRHEVDDLPLWRDFPTHEVMKQILDKHGVDEEIFARLISSYRSHAHKQRPRGITSDFDDIFQSVGGGE